MPVVYKFVVESNRIEGIFKTLPAEVDAHIHFMELDVVEIEHLEKLVSICQPGALLRDKAGMDVRVGNYYPPPGGPEIRKSLQILLDNMAEWSPYEAHVAYEQLHPFMDGNGRSGRALWLWKMGHVPQLGFLHTFYYQALAAADSL